VTLGHNAEKIATLDTKIRAVRHLPGATAPGATKAVHRHGYQSAASAERASRVRFVDMPLLANIGVIYS
jgi:hypothetical protein